jgi:hypothetical protein
LTIKPLDLMIAGIGGGTEMSFHHTMAANNTYDFNVSNETTYAFSIATLPKTRDLTILAVVETLLKNVLKEVGPIYGMNL